MIDCSLNYKFNTWKFQAQTWREHVVYRNCFWHSEQFLYTTCPHHVEQKEELLKKIYLYFCQLRVWHDYKQLFKAVFLCLHGQKNIFLFFKKYCSVRTKTVSRSLSKGFTYTYFFAVHTAHTNIHNFLSITQSISFVHSSIKGSLKD